jgi:glycosyltransferase involved in cell wall biosynthesis
MASGLGVGDRLHFLQPVAPAQLELSGSIFDLGLVAEQPDTLNRRICLTNKLFSYLTSGLPVLASDTLANIGIASDFAEAIKIFPAMDSQMLADAIDHWLLDPLRLAKARQIAWQLAQDRYNWQVESLKFVEFVQRTVAEGRNDG